MLVRVFRSEGCRLRADQREEKEQYEQPLRLAANVYHFAHYTRAWEVPGPNEKRAPAKGPPANTILGMNLDAADVLGLQALWPLLHLELHLRALIQ